MDIELKQRIIGAIVIFGLLIIFLPMMFENHQDNFAIEQTLLPPEINTTDMNALYDSTISESEKNNAIQAAKDESQTIKQSVTISKAHNNPVQFQVDNQSTPQPITSNISLKKDNKKTLELNISSKKIKYNLANDSLSKNEVYTIQLETSLNNSQALKLKEKLLKMGFPAYIFTDNSTNSFIAVGPDRELKYIEELANRIIDETSYQPVIISHNKDWKSKI